MYIIIYNVNSYFCYYGYFAIFHSNTLIGRVELWILHQSEREGRSCAGRKSAPDNHPSRCVPRLNSHPPKIETTQTRSLKFPGCWRGAISTSGSRGHTNSANLSESDCCTFGLLVNRYPRHGNHQLIFIALRASLAFNFYYTIRSLTQLGYHYVASPNLELYSFAEAITYTWLR